MNGLLRDANVVSEMFKPRPHMPVVRFLESAHPDALFLSVLTLGELRKGANRWAFRNPDQPNHLSSWIGNIETDYQTRLLDVTLLITDRWAWFQRDRDRAEIDTLLAATASVHDLTMVTRNVRDFEGLPVRVLNPWQP